MEEVQQLRILFIVEVEIKEPLKRVKLRKQDGGFEVPLNVEKVIFREFDNLAITPICHIVENRSF